ncbi:MAG TPA: flagellar basal body rod protein FlgC [Fimbriimonadaceae bacterium]|nr:flagellar basal body rod protein FlgC [Fimbriimonadaceae bacterium]HRJ33455.1 flagellar basal body rod protein FlgC [Fimbriimonadaceae bacterium]
MTLSGAMRMSSSGMTAERFRMDVISTNLANANSVSINGQEPYRRREVRLETTQDGVRVAAIVPDQRPFRVVYEPNNPNANRDGFVSYSNIEPLQEMVSMISAARSYEANISAFNSARGMIRAAMTIGRM